ncbi:hypothetical protein EVAR_5271_1 [Eumeta japonica]|uniref:Uncharacterized protein n=1 Tax=Eumeta variegata TaxID=151549 RepID=A0A4C1TN42_EUMVA|nr:hypothetical protein EVAR_5271_1 [Eumeta japonica]
MIVSDLLFDHVCGVALENLKLKFQEVTLFGGVCDRRLIAQRFAGAALSNKVRTEMCSRITSPESRDRWNPALRRSKGVMHSAVLDVISARIVVT